MKLFKTVDEKLADIGFVKLKENEYGADYQRTNLEFNYTQALDLCYKENGKHIIQSYDINLLDSKGIGNTGIGLTMYEMKLCLKKMKQMGWKICKRNGAN